MQCRWCETALHYRHGHGACLNKACPMFGLDQAGCCEGETGSPAMRADAGLQR